MKTFTLAFVSLSIFLAACEDPAANKPKATTANSTNNATINASTPAATAAKGESIAITPENSKVLFTGSKVTGKHEGGFNKFTGTIELVNGKAEESKVSVDIDSLSIFTDTEKLTVHLKSADFFDAEKFPKASFTSSKIVPDPAKGADNFTVTGDLDLHGQKKSITFPATIKVTANEVAVHADFSINRRDFGINYAGPANDLINDDVVLKLDLKATRKK